MKPDNGSFCYTDLFSQKHVFPKADKIKAETTTQITEAMLNVTAVGGATKGHSIGVAHSSSSKVKMATVETAL